MPIFVDPKTGEQFENYEPDAAEKAAQFGFVTPEQYAAEQRSGTIGGQLKTVGEEAIRQGAAVADLIPGVDAGAAPAGLTELEPGQAPNPLTNVYSPEARERRAVNPGAAGIGGALPAVAASTLLPGSGLVGLATTIGVDALSGYSQAAVDAELENRDINGEEVLRNAGLNLAFSLPLYGLGEAARAALAPGAKTALQRGADSARDVASRRAAAAEGAELAQAVADPAVQADLLDRVAASAEDAVGRAHERVGGFAPPTVAKNPKAQRAAVGAVADGLRTVDPDLAARLDALTEGPGKKRLEGLRAIRDELAAAGESDTLTAVDAILGREDLWGSKAIRGSSDIDAVLSSRPGVGADPEELIEYAAKVRGVRDGELAGLADEIEQLAERQLEVRTASVIGDTAPEAANDVVDYAQAMREMSPEEAWRLTRDGADDGLRQLESTSVSDAMQRVDDVLREDVAMSVKQSDFVKGAETWTPAQVAKQSEWAEQMRGRAMALAGKLADAETQGFRIGGFRGEATSLVDRAIQRLADADPVTANFEWDQLKRGLDSIAKRLAATGPAIDDASKAWGSKAILELNDDLRKGLEDSELWGRNAGLQKETNAAWVKVIDPYSRVTKRMAEFLGREFGVVGQAGIRRRFDPDMIDSIMSRGYQRNLRADVDASIKGLDQMMQARQAQGLSRLDRLSQARADLVRIQQGFDFADMLAVAKSKAKAPIGLEIAQRLGGAAQPGGIVGSVVGPVAQRIGGTLVGDMPLLAPGSKSAMSAAVKRHVGLVRGEQAGMLADAAFHERLPASLQKQLMAGAAASERTVELAQTAADAAKRDRELTVRLMVNPEQAKRARKLHRKNHTTAGERATRRSGERGAATAGALSAGTSAAGGVVAYHHLGQDAPPDPETTSALDRFSEGYEKPIDAFRAARKMVMGWAQNPDSLVDAITADIGALGEQSPKLEREMTAQAMRVAAYLQVNLPGQRNVSVVYPEGTPPSRAEVRQFALRFDAAVNPAGVMADARAGRLERVQLDTLQALWPREYDALRAGVIQELGKGAATPRTRQRMSLLFGFGSEVDPALGPRTRAVVAAARAAQEAQTPPPSSPGMNRQRLPSTATMQPAGMAALSLGQQIGAP